MRSALRVAVVLLAATSRARTSGQPCLCSALLPAGLKVNCSFSRLVELPRLPSDTKELHMRHNQLTSVPPGLFDRLVGLEKVSLAGNPFHCDCRIQYLRNWLIKNRDVVSGEPTCVSPGPVATKAIRELGDGYFSVCAPASCTDGLFNIVMVAMLGCLLLLLLRAVKVAKMSSVTLYMDEKHLGIETDSLKPKHRRRFHDGPPQAGLDSDTLASVDLERPLINMDLLQQVLQVLHEKHNIKITPPEGPLVQPQRNSNNT
ncbi:platelet glycoprotein IX [Brachionichthys hirsutus]|uniref:platelet glycoprotein IX n=1 Tax=Brachionichthys hirsutus TaxID=412623 RepID=UPI00360536A0